MGRRLIGASVLLLGLSVIAGGCGTPSAPTPAAQPEISASSETPSATRSATPSAGPSLTAAPSPSATPVTPTQPQVSRAGRPVTRAQLRKALLNIHDVPAGFELVKDQGDAGDQASSKNAACSALVRLLNAPKLPGSLANASVSFDGGQDGAFVAEDLDALASTRAAQSIVDGYRHSVKQCHNLTYRIHGVGSSTLSVRPISFAAIGDGSFVARFRADRGPLAGFEIIQVGARLGRVVMGMSFVGMDPSDAEAASQGAADKVQSKMGSSAST